MMNIFVKPILGLSLLGFVAGTGALQAAQQAKFHLSEPAVWSNVELQPGDYSVSLPEVGFPQRILSLTGEGKHVFLTIQSTDINIAANDLNDRSYLKLRDVDGKHYIESYRVANSKEFSFAVPKAKYKLQIGKQTTQKIDVSGI